MSGIPEHWHLVQVIRNLNAFLLGKSNEAVSSWDDMQFPATAINPPGQASDPDFDIVNGGWLFDSTSTELIFLMAQIPHAWDVGTPLNPHVHWQKTTDAAGDVFWQLDYKWCPIGEVMDAAFTTLTADTVATGTPDTDTTDKHLITGFTDIAGTGKGISDMLVMKLSRIGGDVDDTYGADARLLEFDIHIAHDTLGSDERFVKN